ncbi:microbial collagenase, secreted [Vibrio sp. JCM 19052]|nr:microbial collagenase, secreted [Vibrio sp. JCM 19052]
MTQIDDINDYQLITFAEAGIAIDLDHGKPIAEDLLMVAYQGKVVTPLTTLVEAKMRMGVTNASEADAYQQAVSEVAQALGVSEASVVSDYIASQTEEAKKVQKSAVSLVASGAMPASVQELEQAQNIIADSEQVNLLVENASDDHIVIKDPETNELILVSTHDSDGDLIIDALDAFPNDDTEWYDTDGDKVGIIKTFSLSTQVRAKIRIKMLLAIMLMLSLTIHQKRQTVIKMVSVITAMPSQMMPQSLKTVTRMVLVTITMRFQMIH